MEHDVAKPGTSASALTHDERECWHRDGFFVRERVFDGDETRALQHAAEAAETAARALCVLGNTYILDGKRFVDIDHVTVQFEHQPGSEDVKVIEPVTDLEPRLAALIDDPRISQPMRDLLGTREISLWTDKLNLKRPGVGSGFGWHQDSPYWIHDHDDVDHLPNVMINFDDADADNGCFAVIRGSHRQGCLPGTDDGSQLGGFYTDPARFDARAESLMAVPAGSLVFFDAHTVHGSRPNHSQRPRRAMIITCQRGARPTLKARQTRSIRD